MSMRQTKQRPTDRRFFIPFHSMRGQFILLTKMSENRVREREREKKEKKERSLITSVSCESTNERMNK